MFSLFVEQKKHHLGAFELNVLWWLSKYLREWSINLKDWQPHLKINLFQSDCAISSHSFQLWCFRKINLSSSPSTSFISDTLKSVTFHSASLIITLKIRSVCKLRLWSAAGVTHGSETSYVSMSVFFAASVKWNEGGHCRVSEQNNQKRSRIMSHLNSQQSEWSIALCSRLLWLKNQRLPGENRTPRLKLHVIYIWIFWCPMSLVQAVIED